MKGRVRRSERFGRDTLAFTLTCLPGQREQYCHRRRERQLPNSGLRRPGPLVHVHQRDRRRANSGLPDEHAAVLSRDGTIADHPGLHLGREARRKAARIRSLGTTAGNFRALLHQIVRNHYIEALFLAMVVDHDDRYLVAGGFFEQPLQLRDRIREFRGTRLRL